MRNLLMAGVAIIALGTAPALAQSSSANTDAMIGAGSGGAGGAALGFVVGGPIGAVVGGFAGALIGGDAAVPDTVVTYVGANPVQPVVLNAPIEVGATLDNSVTVTPVPSDPKYGYIYTNNRVYVVDNASRQVVMSPGYAVPNSTVSYIEANPSQPVVIDGDVQAGYQLDPGVQVTQIPDNSSYSYVYINDRPALIDNSTNTVVWIK